MKKLLLTLGLILPFIASAQPYSVDWYKIAGGGGTSAGAMYTVSGTIGQHDAGGQMTGTNFSLTGGFWGAVAVVQSPGVPNLAIRYLNPGSVVVSWPATGNYSLQQSGDLTGNLWMTGGYSVSTANGTNSVTITPPAGNLFFRLSKP